MRRLRPTSITRNKIISFFILSGLFFGMLSHSKANPYFMKLIATVSNLVSASWIGTMGIPTGSFSATTGTVAGSADGLMYAPNHVVTDGSGVIYVLDSGNGRISKYSSTGTFVGWIGSIEISPTGGAAGCNGAAVGTFTPGWCTGGKPTPGSGDGMLLNPSSLFLDGSGGLYVSDTSNNRVVKYNSATGAFIGWIGKINSSPTGGVAGCNGAAVGTATPGWCTGGTTSGGTGDGMLVGPLGVFVDGGGILYVAETARVDKFNASTGAFLGWIGKIGTSPTGGDAGCSGAAVGTFTPGWCKGGTASSSGMIDGMIAAGSGVFVDSGGNLYVTDRTQSRINKYTASTGAFIGWIGKINASPTGGDAGCSGAASGTFTPGWCKGGSPNQGTGDGAMSAPNKVFVDGGGSLYVTDTNNNRINKYTASSGAFVGWIGNIGSSPTGGDTTCVGAALGTFTPGWCKGGYGSYGGGNGMMNIPLGVFGDSGGNLFVADAGNNRINKYVASTGASLGALGANPSFQTWNNSSTASVSGTGDGMMTSAYGMLTDSSGYLYVMDTMNARINKYVANTGAFVGWIGRISTSPTGGAAGCNGAAVGNFTPGWCTGGTSTSGTGDGMMTNPFSGVIDSNGYLYVSEYSQGRLLKFVASTGAFVGWVGKINTSPTGGAAGCNGAAVGTFTPGWCTGGTSIAGTGDGMVTNPSELALDNAGNLYVADALNYRVSKFAASSGAFLGWIGKIGTSPTGGAAGCNGAAVGTLTPGWCTGGTAANGNGDGMFNIVLGLALDNDGNLFAVDMAGVRLNKFVASTGAFVGWVGGISSSPTGGASGCSGAAAGTATPGWCSGGSAGSGTGAGMFTQPVSVATDKKGFVYVSDLSSHRVSKFSASTGHFVGWMGAVGVSPTGGAPGCKGASVGILSPGWCQGGASTPGSGNGMLNSPTGIFVAPNGDIYVADSVNSRIVKYQQR